MSACQNSLIIFFSVQFLMIFELFEGHTKSQFLSALIKFITDRTVAREVEMCTDN